MLSVIRRTRATWPSDPQPELAAWLAPSGLPRWPSVSAHGSPVVQKYATTDREAMRQVRGPAAGTGAYTSGYTTSLTLS